MSKWIFLTGGSGYIGSHLVWALADRGDEGVILDDLSTGHSEAADPRAKLISGSVLDPATLGRTFAESRYDAVMHFAAKSIVPQSMQERSTKKSPGVFSGRRASTLAISHCIAGGHGSC